MDLNRDKEEIAAQLKGSLLEFTKTFYPLLTGRDFIVSCPEGRESHHVTVCRALTQLFREQKEAYGLLINMPPGYGKSVMTCMWVAWCYAHYPDCNFLYISYAHELAASHTSFIKQIMSSQHYQYLFDVHISRETRAKDHFMTTAGGCTAAFGSSGPITGRNAGLSGQKRFTGCALIDDAHKPSEVFSDSIREKVIKNYHDTILQRPRDVNVPILFIGQCLHEDDLAAYFKSGNDVRKWDSVVLPGIDAAGNALYPEVQPLSYLKELEEKQPFVFHSQIQQNPIPSEGSLFKKEWFRILDKEPEILYTFITADTAETDKTYNDATAFGFWGLYEIEIMGRKIGEYGLHWIDAWEIFVEPKDLRDNFIEFWSECMRHPVKPLVAAIEKKSTGTTLLSVLKEMPGIQVRDIPRDRSSGSKTTRFIEIQEHIASKKISFTAGAKHVEKCIEHMSKITANDAHKRDDLCFVGETKIAAVRGEIKIKDIKIGDKVITPFGIGVVSASGCTGSHEVIENLGLIGTKSHPVFDGYSFSCLDTVTDASKINRLSLLGLLVWRYRKLLYSMELNTDLWARKDIILVSKKKPIRDAVLKGCMLRYGNTSVARRFQLVMWFITKIIIHSITIMKTWSAFRARSISRAMQKIELNGIIAQRTKKLSKLLKRKLKNGIKVLRELSGIEKMRKPVLTSHENLIAEYVGMNSLQELPKQFIAQKNVTILNTREKRDIREQRCSHLLQNALFVKLNSHLYQRAESQEKHVPQYAQENLEQEVYNITVEPYGVYYANGILVSNCDTAADAIKLALIDKTLYHSSNKDSAANAVLSQIGASMRRQSVLRNAQYGGIR